MQPKTYIYIYSCASVGVVLSFLFIIFEISYIFLLLLSPPLASTGATKSR